MFKRVNRARIVDKCQWLFMGHVRWRKVVEKSYRYLFGSIKDNKYSFSSAANVTNNDSHRRLRININLVCSAERLRWHWAPASLIPGEISNEDQHQTSPDWEVRWLPRRRRQKFLHHRKGDSLTWFKTGSDLRGIKEIVLSGVFLWSPDMLKEI